MNSKKADLTNLAIDINRRNKFFQQLLKALKKLEKTKSDDMSIQLREIVNMMSSHLRISEDFVQFQKNIEDINQAFYQKLEAQFGALSKTEKFLCGLIRLNLSNKDIAAIRGISPGSAKMSRHRLRKKLGLEPEVDIVRFLEGV